LHTTIFGLNVYIKSCPRLEIVKIAMTENDTEKYQFLVKLALENGASDAKIIPTRKVVVEDRVVLKCKVGCNHYGKTLACPPYTPSAEEFRKIVSEYSFAMFMKYKSTAEASPEVLSKLMVAETDPCVSKEIKEKAAKFWQDWKDDKRKMLESVVGLEKAAMNKGYSLAISFISGHCQLCEKCNTETRICRNPNLARWSEDAVGVNVKKTAANAGITVTFPFAKNPESFAILLID
jgi:predicted metal-binding protein